jgi:Protein of unknown function (DUF2586)
MSTPAVNITVLDGQTGVQPPKSKILAVIGPCIAGATEVPTLSGRKQEIIANNTGGPAAEAAATASEYAGCQILMVRTGATNDGTLEVDDTDVAGTSAVTDGSGAAPTDEFEGRLLVVAGGTIGVDGITYKLSYDGGRNYGPVQQLGTATTLVVAGIGTLAFAAGTLIAGDVVTMQTTQPTPDNTEIADAFTALSQSSYDPDMVELAFPITSTNFATVVAGMVAMKAQGKEAVWIGHVRMPDITIAGAESFAEYITAIDAVVDGLASNNDGDLWAGSWESNSSISGRKYRRPPSYFAAARLMQVKRHIHIADVNLGSWPGTLTDDAKNPKHHNERIHGGLDDLRLSTLTTVVGRGNLVYPNRDRCFSAPGSDFFLMVYARVMALMKVTAREFFTPRLHKPIQVNKSTGFIAESEREEMQRSAESYMRSVLMADPMLSSVTVSIAKNDNLISTRTLTVDIRGIPLGYPDTINITEAFSNPALSLV